ncbi:MAG TPA: hypothetical protein VGE98_07075, partial [Thermoanaerobaculia bacterium]
GAGLLFATAAVVVALGFAAPAHAADNTLGFGLHYWRAVDDLRSEGFDVDRSGTSGIVSYQYAPGGLLKIEGDFEYFDKGFGGANKAAYSPQLYLVVGGSLYGALGVGVTYSKGFPHRNFSDPFYAARVGLDFILLPRIHLDVNANYRFNAWNQLKNADTGTVTLGALVRFGF